MKEIWKDIKGYEGLYQVSNFGEIYSHISKKKLKPMVDNKGYKRINLYLNRKIKNVQIHRLVAEAFIPNPNKYPVVNHKDENPLNNHVKNLEWCTYEYNNNYMNRNKKLSKSLKGKVTLGEKAYRKVICITTLKVFNSIKEASLFYNCNKNTICMVCRGERNFSGKLADGTKLKWMYYEEYLKTLG